VGETGKGKTCSKMISRHFFLYRTIDLWVLLINGLKGCVTWRWRFEPIFEYDIADILPNNRNFIRLLLVHSLPALLEVFCKARTSSCWLPYCLELNLFSLLQ
jgi:hypothetical protein